jgi:hypothetical protein
MTFGEQHVRPVGAVVVIGLQDLYGGPPHLRGSCGGTNLDRCSGSTFCEGFARGRSHSGSSRWYEAGLTGRSQGDSELLGDHLLQRRERGERSQV